MLNDDVLSASECFVFELQPKAVATRIDLPPRRALLA